MAEDLGMMEPSPFDPDDPDEPRARRYRPWEPAQPMTVRDLEIWIAMTPDARVHDAYRCMYNLTAEDGIGHMSGSWVQCSTRIADPTKSRYCMTHAEKLGVDYWSPPEWSEAIAKETNANLTRLVPKAVRTLEAVMDDAEAPPGIRAKAADSVLDRTGYAKGVDVKVDAQVAVVDITGVIKERLTALREAQLKETAAPSAPADGGDAVAETPELPASAATVDGEIINRDGSDPSPESA
jgi:hypothetical protein